MFINIIEKKRLKGGRIAIVTEDKVFILSYPITNFDQIEVIDRQTYEDENF